MKLLYKKDGGFTKGSLQFTDKGEYEVEDKIADSLCKTFPAWFEAIAPKTKPEAKTETRKTTSKK